MKPLNEKRISAMLCVGRWALTRVRVCRWGDEEGASTSEFGGAPLKHMTAVGEHLLTLVQHLEPFAPHFERAGDMSGGAASRMLAEVDGLGRQGREALLTELCRADAAQRKQAAELGVASEATADMGEEIKEDEKHMGFSAVWVRAVAHGSVTRLLSCALKIERLSDTGARQLSLDLSYVVNVLSALDADEEPLLATFQQALAMTKDELRDLIRTPASPFASDQGRAVAREVATRRGISLDF